MIRRFSPLSLLIVLLLGTGGSVLAADSARLPETVSRIERETGARVLSAQRSTRGGREVNRIKVLTPEGRVRVMWDDPQRDRGAGARRERGLQPAVEATPAALGDREAPARDDG
jgi:hypothetical protein